MKKRKKAVRLILTAFLHFWFLLGFGRSQLFIDSLDEKSGTFFRVGFPVAEKLLGKEIGSVCVFQRGTLENRIEFKLSPFCHLRVSGCRYAF